MQIIQGDNLDTLRKLKEEGAKFDLVEFDGPYMAGLEKWDNLTEAEYLQHYVERLTLTRDILHPWGVVFLFGYPEGCAEVKAWAHRNGILRLRRWIHWYKQRCAHKGRRVEIICLFIQANNGLLDDFKAFLRKERKKRGLTISDAMALTKCRGHLAGKGAGMMWFEAPSSHPPTGPEYAELKSIFGLPNRYDILLTLRSYQGITDLDFISTVYPEDTESLSNNGLRSKPVQLYLDLFTPTIPLTENHSALILYGGSGNAGIAAAALGYNVTICEIDAERCEAIRERWDKEVAKWRPYANSTQLTLPEPQQLGLEI